MSYKLQDRRNQGQILLDSKINGDKWYHSKGKGRLRKERLKEKRGSDRRNLGPT